MQENEINPFDQSTYSTNPVELPQELESTESVESQVSTESNKEATQIESQTTETAVDTTQEVQQQQESEEVEQQPYQFEWPNETAKQIYDNLISGNISDLADMIYEQKVLSNLDQMSDADLIKLKLAYEYPDLTPEEIEEEFNSKYGVEDNVDKSLMTDEEIAIYEKKMERQMKAINREMKKGGRDAKDYLSEMKQEISFPDILSQVQNTEATMSQEEFLNQFFEQQEAEESKVHNEARNVFLSSVDEGLKGFEGFNVNYKDGDVQFDGKFSLTPDEKTALSSTLKDFDLEEFYGSRYFKDGKYDAKQLAEDVYFLQNRDKIVNSFITQAVSKAKSDLLKTMKNIDYNDAPRIGASAASNDDYDAMVSKLFSL